VRDDHRGIFRAQRQRIVREFKGLLGACEGAPAGVMAHPALRHIGCVERGTDADEHDALAVGGGLHRALDGRARFREDLLD